MTSLVATVATSSVTTGLIILSINKLIEARARLRAASLGVLHIVTRLEFYASDCLDWLQDEEQDGYISRMIREEKGEPAAFPIVPAFDTLASAVDWKAIGVADAQRVMNFEVSVRNYRASAALRWSPYLPDALAKVRLYTASVATEAMELSEQLRTRWQLAEIRSAVPEGTKADLEKMVRQFEAERKHIEWRTSGMDEADEPTSAQPEPSDP